MVNEPPLPIAVVGVGGVFPGALDLDAYWRNLRGGACATREAPPGRWVLDPTDAYDPHPSPDHCYSTRGCFVDGFSFDPAGLALDPASLDSLDPVYQLALHAGRQAWAEAATAAVDRTRVGVILAAIALPTDGSSQISQATLGRLFERPLLGAVIATSASQSPAWANARVTARPAGLLAAALGLGGGSFTLDAACASSLYAVKLACDALRSHRTDAMLAGGVSRPECLYTQMGFSQLRALSPSGVCRPFDAAADGLIVGEGAGVVVLKRLDDAIAAGDAIYAVIRGCGLSNDVAGSLLAADSKGQLRAMRAAYAQAGWRPAEIDLIECHGTGTPVGDVAEIVSLRELWGAGDWRAGQCPIGSVKSNIGHLLTAAGAAGLIKTLLALRERTIPPSVNFERAAPSGGLADGPFRVPTQAGVWNRRNEQTPRRAAVSAFGFGGINAHLLVEEFDPAIRRDAKRTLAKPTAPPARERVDVAIVGMDARFGSLGSLAEFRDLLFSGGSAIAPRRNTRWRGAEMLAAGPLGDRELPGAYIDSLSIPVGAFRLPPNEIPEVLPQQLLMLQSVAQALKDARVSRGEHAERTSVIVGMSLDLNTTNFHLRWSLLPRARRWAEQLGLELTDAQLRQWVDRLRDECGPALTPGCVVGALGNIIASRIAREFGFGGPSYAVSSEESSGITALDIAAAALRAGEIDVAVVGAVDLPGDVRHVLATHAQRSYSASGRVLPFDPASDGTLPGEGAAAIVLKRLPDAQAGGDRVYATLCGVGFAGGAGDQTADPTICSRAMRRAWQDGEIDPQQIGLIETHGSGDPAEDASEAVALCEVFPRAANSKLPIGSVKPMIGHTGAAAGLASVVKACLCLHEQIIPPMVADESRAPSRLGDGFESPTASRAWLANRADGPRCAAVNVLSCDGGAAHVVLEAAPQSAHRELEFMPPARPASTAVFGVSGDDHAALLAGLETLLDHAAASDASIERAALAWQHNHPPRSGCRLAVGLVASNTHELAAVTESAARRLQTEPSVALRGEQGVWYSPQPLASRGQVAFVFPGSGSHYPRMGQGAFAQWPSVVRRLDTETGFLRSQMTCPADERDTAGAIMAQVAHGIAMSDLLRSLGVEPAATIGYSLGETTAMFATRAWRDRDEMHRRLLDSPLFQSQLAGRCDAARAAWGLSDDEPVDWCVVALDRPAAIVREALADRERAYLLIVNTPDECVVGGQRGEIDRLVSDLRCNAIEIRGASTVHCPIARQVERAYREFHSLATTPPPGIRFYGAAWGRQFELTRASAADSIAAQAMAGFDFPALIEQAYADGVRVFVEPGPGNTCTRMIGRILADRPHVACHATTARESEATSILKLVAAMFAERVIPDLAALYPHAGERLAIGAAEKPSGKCIVVHTGGNPPRPSLPPGYAAPTHTPAPSGPPERTLAEPDVGSAKPNRIESPSTQIAAQTPVPVTGHSLAAEVARTATATAEAHNAFLQFSEGAMAGMGQALALEAKLLQHGARSSTGLALAAAAPATSLPPAAPAQNAAIAPPSPGPAATPPRAAPQFPREMCMEFAIGSAARVLGLEFAAVDRYPVRVRLPDEPLMLVDRILEVDAVKGSLDSGRVVTEHDVLPGAWYLDGGRAPVCITVEAGQADLFLCSYLGIDLAVKGTRAYRLLDATVTFHRGLPQPGETVRYDICIDRFVRQGETYLFFFRFEGTVDGRPLLTMAEGCAGFFTKQEIAESGGIVETAEQRAPAAGTRPADWRPLAPMRAESYNERQIDALRAGDLTACFGEAFANLAVSDPARIPGGRMRLVHRVTSIEPDGGRFRLGLIRAEADIAGDEWFLKCHFVDDMVMPGTLMYECCMHTLRIFLLRMGWVTEQANVCYEPIPGVASKLTCRGPVTPETKVVTYEIHIKEIGYGPEPYAIAYALMYADGEKIVRFTDMSIKLTGASREQIESLWPEIEQRPGGMLAAPSKHVPPTGEHACPKQRACHTPQAVAPIGDEPVAAGAKPAIFDDDRILAFAIGKPSGAFGEPYRVFDAERRIARLPGPPYKFLNRITEIQAEAWKLEPGGWIEAQYDVPPDAWYFRANRQASMPFAVLLEIALQPCGWLAAFLGSALRSEQDLSFRNLGGTATLYEEVFADAGTLTIRSKIKRVSEAGGMLIENFDMQIWRAGRIVYDGETAFGFFSADALANQLGIRDAGERLYVPSESELRRAKPVALDRVAPLSPDDLDSAQAAVAAAADKSQPETGCHCSVSSVFAGQGAAMPAGAFLMIDKIESFMPDGGPHGLGFVRGIMHVDPEAWFFKAHFYQDPVVPGSLGLESFLQLLKLAALDRWGDALRETHRFTPILVGHEHTWVYRGQVTPRNRRVEVEVVVTEVRDGPRPAIMASAFLKVDGLVIYEMPEFGIALEPNE